MAITIESTGRRKDGALYVKAAGHYWSQSRNGPIHANYHGNPVCYRILLGDCAASNLKSALSSNCPGSRCWTNFSAT